MTKVFIISLLLMSITVHASTQEGRVLLRDGFYINGAEGRMVGPESRGIFRFIIDSDISDGFTVIKAGASFELLPSAGLMKMRENYRPGEPYGFKLWARVTTYRGKNYLFTVRFLPFKQLDREKQPQQTVLKVNDPNDPLNIPADILEKLTSGREILPIQLRPGLELKEDYMLVDRTGRIEPHENGQFFFIFDSLGRNVDKTKIILLPCQALETVLAGQKNEQSVGRIKVAGIITAYEGEIYLLLQRAIRVRSYGNFSN